MTSHVMLRWVVPALPRYDSPRALIRELISPVVRGGGWLSSPGTTHAVREREAAAWVTVVTQVDDVVDVQDQLSELLMAPPSMESTHDDLLVQGGDWYREALQVVTHVGLDVVDAKATLPLSEYEAFENPGEAALRLIPFLNDVSTTYHRACPTYDSTERFWTGFFRRAPAPGLSRSGRLLWNLAG